MIVNLRELAQSDSPLELHGQVSAEDTVAGRNDFKLAGPIEASLTARSAEGTAVVYGVTSAELELVCSRCLRETKERFEFSVTEMFTLQAEIAERDDDIHFVRDEIVDLAPYVREAFAVQLPMAAVCSEDCKGLCPECGADRNTEACSCSQERVDPRLAGLKDFFKK